MKNACEGVLYPQAAASKIQLTTQDKAPKFCTLANTNLRAIEVPHKAWIYCKEELENTFSYLRQQNKAVSNIFVLAPLHKGSLDFDVKLKIYCPEDGTLKGSDWELKLETPQEIKALPFLEQNDDVCTEEHSLEVLAPFIYATCHANHCEAKVCYLLAPKQENKIEEICEITSIIGRSYPDSLIFISNNSKTNCGAMWIRRD